MSQMCSIHTPKGGHKLVRLANADKEKDSEQQGAVQQSRHLSQELCLELTEFKRNLSDLFVKLHILAFGDQTRSIHPPFVAL